MERDQLRVAKPQNSGPWYDQDPAELARFRREEAARFRQGAAKARSLLGTLDGDGQRGFLFTERERLTMRFTVGCAPPQLGPSLRVPCEAREVGGPG